MSQIPPDHQSQGKPKRAQQIHLVQWYRRRTLKTKLGLWSVVALILLVLVGSVLVARRPFSRPIQNAGVSITAIPQNTYYVSPFGNDGNDGSITRPFATIQKAANVAQAGATIHVLPGTYTTPLNTYAKGTVDARITFISDVKWGAKIKTSKVPTSWTNWGNYVDIQGFDITGDGTIGINNYGSYVRIIGNHVHNYALTYCGSNGAAGIDDSANNGNHDNQVIGNVVNNIGPTFPTYCNQDQGIYHSTPGGYIANNIVYRVAAFGIYTWNSASNITIANNLVFECGQGGIIIGANQTLADNFLVVNNISIHNHHLGFYEFGTTGIHNRFLNNLVYANPINLLLQHGNTAPGTLKVDPRLVNYQPDGSGDYHLSARSPAIGAGSSTGAISFDMDSVPRALGKAVDIGPYVYLSLSSLRKR